MAFNMTLTPAQQDLVERTHRFAEEVIRPVAEQYDREEKFPRQLFTKMAYQLLKLLEGFDVRTFAV